MTALEVRNAIVEGLEKHLGVHVVPSDAVQPEEIPPFCIYTMTTFSMPENGHGDYFKDETPGGIRNNRVVSTIATFSFTFCSQDRRKGKEWMLGEDEAIALADKARGWFEHVAYEVLSAKGIVVVDVMNYANRSLFMIDEAMKRHGFDVKIRYCSMDERRDPTIDDITISRE